MLPPNWQRLSTRELRRILDDIENEPCLIEPDTTNEDRESIYEELALRTRDDQEPVDFDEQDRRAASEERLDNLRRER